MLHIYLVRRLYAALLLIENGLLGSVIVLTLIFLFLLLMLMSVVRYCVPS